MTILVTGASGNIGKRVVRALAKDGRKVRAFVRKESDAIPAGVAVSRGDFADRSSLDRALAGVQKIFALTIGPSIAEHDANLIDAAERAGVEHIVKLSVLGAPAEANAIQRWHRRGEKRLEDSKLAWTLLRPSSFASNALAWVKTIAKDGVAYGALGDTALPVIHPDDIADVAVLALTAPGHERRAYELTGPQSISPADQVAVLAEVLGRTIRYVNVPDAAARQGMISSGVEAEMADALLELIAGVRRLGHVDPKPAVAELLGRPGKTFRAWAEENARAFA